MADIHIDSDQLAHLQQQMSTLATTIGEVAGGAYVSRTMFTETRASSAVALDATLHTLVQAAQAMQQCAQALANYLDLVFVEFEATDLTLAAHANRLPVPGRP